MSVENPLPVAEERLSQAGSITKTFARLIPPVNPVSIANCIHLLARDPAARR